MYILKENQLLAHVCCNLKTKTTNITSNRHAIVSFFATVYAD